MLDRRIYPNPPLVEVYSELLFVPADDRAWDVLGLSKFYERIGGPDRFPDRREAAAFGRAIRSDARRAGAGKRSARRLWQFISADGNTVTQVGDNTLVLNQLPPYYGWDNFAQDTSRAVDAYLAVWPAKAVEAMGLHYIDSIVIPGETVEIEEYFNLFPVLPDQFLERPLINLAMSCEVEGDGEGELFSFTFRQQEEDEDDPLQAVFRLTWDYRATLPFAADRAQISAFLDRAHKRTSEAFRASLTPKCAALFERE